MKTSFAIIGCPTAYMKSTINDVRVIGARRLVAAILKYFLAYVRRFNFFLLKYHILLQTVGTITSNQVPHV